MQRQLQAKFANTWNGVSMSWRMWAVDILAPADITARLTDTEGPPSSMIHLFKLRKLCPEATGDHQRNNTVALTGLVRNIRHTLEQLVSTVDIYIHSLQEQQSLIEETSSSRAFAAAVTSQEDIDHQ